MSNESPGDDIKTRVAALIDGGSVDTTGPVSVVNRTTFTEALTQDSGAADEQATVDRERLAKVEAQTRVLAEAVIAIADTAPSIAVAPAVKAVKAEMKGDATASVAPPPGQVLRRAGEQLDGGRSTAIVECAVQHACHTPWGIGRRKPSCLTGAERGKNRTPNSSKANKCCPMRLPNSVSELRTLGLPRLPKCKTTRGKLVATKTVACAPNTTSPNVAAADLVRAVLMM